MFKNPNQRKFLFAMDKDKQKGIPVQKSSGQIIPTIPNPSAAVPTTIQPTAVPSLPALPKVPKFGKVRQYFKKKV